MSIKNTLTNEKLRDRFDNPFALVNYAISLAKKRLARGEGLDANPVNEVLDDIVNKYDILDTEEEKLELDEESEEASE